MKIHVGRGWKCLERRVGDRGLGNTYELSLCTCRSLSNSIGPLRRAARDVNAYGTAYSMSSTAANYTVSNTARGRATMHLAFTFGRKTHSMNFVFYDLN